jgi:hypothetical protein
VEFQYKKKTCVVEGLGASRRRASQCFHSSGFVMRKARGII